MLTSDYITLVIIPFDHPMVYFYHFFQHFRAKRKDFLNTGIPDCPASCQSGTGLEKTNDAVSSPVPE
jgi:hypothetical protein